MSPRRVPGLSGLSIQLTFVGFRAAGIRPYGWVLLIHRTLLKNPTAVSPLQSALRAASFPQGKLLEGAEAGAIQRGAIEVATLWGDRLPPPTDSETFFCFHFLFPFNGQLRPGTWRAAGIRPEFLPLIRIFQGSQEGGAKIFAHARLRLDSEKRLVYNHLDKLKI